ncbi:MAG: methyltransferase domain-containing protein [Rhodospirillales bacterium]|nr:methyltransferase domain-containing protein [Rhodospirillales bacterium]
MTEPTPWTAADIAAFLAFWLANPVLSAASQDVFDRYYASYRRHFGPYLRHWYARQTEELIGLARALDRPRVLEIGCGCGTESLWTALAGADVVAIDIFDDLLTTARERQAWLEARSGVKLTCQFLNRSVLSADDLGQFDIVYMEQAFHHMEPRAEVVRRIADRVRPGGYLVIAEANAWNPFLQAHLLRLRGTTTIIEMGGHPWGHERVIIPAALLRHFRRFGFARHRLRYFRTLPNLRIGDRLLWLDRRVPGFLRPLFTHYNLVLRKAAAPALDAPGAGS